MYEKLIRTGRVDAFVMASTVANDERIRFLMDKDVPFVSFGRSNPEWDFPWVDTDGTDGVRQSVEHLVKLGHERIALVCWPEESITGNFRLAGYYEAMECAGLPVHPAYVVRGLGAEHTGREAVAHWLSLPANQQPTAVISIDDLMAIGVMNEATERGLKVGEDFAVIGFDDIPLGEYLRPPLTTLRQPINEICRLLVTMLEDIVNNRPPQPRQSLLAPELIVRKSCGAWQQEQSRSR